MDLAAGRVGKVPVHLGDDDTCRLGGGLGVVRGEAVAAEALLIGWRDLQQGHVDGQNLAFEKTRHFGEEAGSESTAILLHSFSSRGAEKESVEAKAMLHPGLGKGGGAHGDHVHDFHIRKLGGPRHQGLDQRSRFAAGVTEYDAVSRI